MDTITYENLDAMQAHFSGKVRESYLPGRKLYTEKCVRKRLFDDSLYNLWFSHICAKNDSKARQYVKLRPCRKPAEGP